MKRVFLSSVKSPIGAFFLLERSGEALMVASSLEMILARLGQWVAAEDAPTALSSRLTAGFSSGDFLLPFAWDYVRGDFEKRVLSLLRHVPCGETTSYGALAELAGSPGAARAVGGAMRKNPLALIIPCHRVLPSTGKVGNYSAGGPAVKKWLLDMESTHAQVPNAFGGGAMFSAAHVQ